ncbi:MAG: hypothetical protein ABFQ62_04795 [Patescibacteria group bacterium]
MKTAKAYSSGRVVLSGEHSVIYGQPAVVASIDMGTNIQIVEGEINGLSKNKHFMIFLKTFGKKLNQDISNLDFKINSNLPQKSGLASSSALAHALIKGLAKYFNIKLSKDELFELVLEAERQIFPASGMDQAAVVYEGLQQVINNKIETTVLKNKKFLLINSGQADEDTAAMVEMVRDKSDKDKIIKKIGKVTKQLIDDLKKNIFIPELISENQELLEDLGVVGDRAKTMIRDIKSTGAVAKITGAGGIKSGSGMLLCYHQDINKLKNLVKNNNWEYYQISL